MRKSKWFQKAVSEGKTTSLDGWKKSESSLKRRRQALSSRPKNWGLKKRYLSSGRALQALSNVTKDKRTKKIARTDAEYFFKKLRKDDN